MKRKWWIVGILVFLELLVCVALSLTLWAGRTAFERVRFFYRADTHVEETVEETFFVDGPAVLDLEAVSGNVTVTGGTEDEVQVIARLSLWGADEEDARQQVDVQMTQEGNRINVRVVRPEWVYFFASTRSPRVDFEVRVPSETSLQLASSSGDLMVSDVTGTVDLQTVSGSIRVEKLNGAVSVRSSSGDITLMGLNNAGDMGVRTVSGDVELRDVTADSLTAQTSSGKFTLTGLSDAGDGEVRTVSGDVKLRDVAGHSLTAHTSSGKIQLDEGTLSGTLDLETTSGNVTAVGIRATSYRLHSSSGDLTLDGCGGPLDIRTVSGRIEVENGTEAELAIETSSGKIQFSGSLYTQGEHRVKSVSGDVRLVLPADAAFDLDIETVSGSIQTEFAVTMTQFDKRRVAGEVNGGGPLLRINTSSGDVTLESATGESN